MLSKKMIYDQLAGLDVAASHIAVFRREDNSAIGCIQQDLTKYLDSVFAYTVREKRNDEISSK
jgi:hypothetical protein